jgi:hypothetical protein
MRLVVDRFYSTREFTLGKLSLVPKDNENAIIEVRGKMISPPGIFLCFTLEDPYQDQKIMGHTRIPEGTYEMVLRPEGGKYQKYLTKLGDWQRPGMLHIKNVPGFEWILVHPGNTTKDTEGCLLVGYGADQMTGTITTSTLAYTNIYKMIANVLVSGDKVSITYEDNDRG